MSSAENPEPQVETPKVEEKDPVFTAKVLDKISNGKGVWNSVKVGVFQDDQLIGEYVRNYPSYAESTFCPFEQNGKWYALYSKEYMYTRVMSLPDCKDLGGECRDTVEYKNHFCPMGYYVPHLCYQKDADDPNDPQPRVANHQPDIWARKEEKNGLTYYIWPDQDPEASDEKKAAFKVAYDESHRLSKEWRERHPFISVDSHYAFVEGCPWGADSYLFVQPIDISKASEGIIKRLGYHFEDLELGPGASICEGALRVENESRQTIDDPKAYVEFAVPRRYSLATGKILK